MRAGLNSTLKSHVPYTIVNGPELPNRAEDCIGTNETRYHVSSKINIPIVDWLVTETCESNFRNISHLDLTYSTTKVRRPCGTAVVLRVLCVRREVANVRLASLVGYIRGFDL